MDFFNLFQNSTATPVHCRTYTLFKISWIALGLKTFNRTLENCRKHIRNTACRLKLCAILNKSTVSSAVWNLENSSSSADWKNSSLWMLLNKCVSVEKGKIRRKSGRNYEQIFISSFLHLLLCSRFRIKQQFGSWIWLQKDKKKEKWQTFSLTSCSN